MKFSVACYLCGAPPRGGTARYHGILVCEDCADYHELPPARFDDERTPVTHTEEVFAEDVGAWRRRFG